MRRSLPELLATKLGVSVTLGGVGVSGVGGFAHNSI